MSFYDYVSTDVSYDYDSYTNLERVETCYHVQEENFDAVLLEDVEFFRVQPWVLDALRPRHPDVSESSVSVKRWEYPDEFEPCTHIYYEVCVVEYFED